MACTVRKVKLPNGIEATEFEEKFGNQETQVTYDYLSEHGTRITKSDFKLDYWGRIEGVEVID